MTDDRRSRAAAARRWLRPDVIVAVVVAVALLAAGALWAQALVAPATREGEPTVMLGPTTSTTPSSTPTVSASAAPSPSAPATPSSSPTAKAPATMKSSGTFAATTVNAAASGSSGALRVYTVQVETSAGLKVDKVATQIAGVLNDPRSWVGAGTVRFQLTADPTKAAITVVLASPKTVAGACKASAGSCLAGGKLFVDALSWKNPPGTYAGNAAAWQQYLINHGMGALLAKKSADCIKAGKPAPVMMAQQSNLRGCTPNPWPFP